jgi:excisionase family DNA binding protein
MLTDPQFMTVAEISAVLRVSNMTVYRLIHRGELDAIQVGRSFRIPAGAATAYLTAVSTTGQASS